MPNITLPNATGIDYQIQVPQTRMFAYLISRWNITKDQYNCFGRTYSNSEKSDKGAVTGYIPQFYDPAKGDYVDGADNNTSGGMFFQDTLACMSFFGLTEPVKKQPNGDDLAKVHLIFCLDLSQITAGGIAIDATGGQRMDEAAIMDVVNFFQNNGCGWTVADRFRKIDKVFEFYSGSIKRNALLDDMQPKLCFRIDIELRYNSQLHN